MKLSQLKHIIKEEIKNLREHILLNEIEDCDEDGDCGSCFCDVVITFPFNTIVIQDVEFELPCEGGTCADCPCSVGGTVPGSSLSVNMQQSLQSQPGTPPTVTVKQHKPKYKQQHV